MNFFPQLRYRQSHPRMYLTFFFDHVGEFQSLKFIKNDPKDKLSDTNYDILYEAKQIKFQYNTGHNKFLTKVVFCITNGKNVENYLIYFVTLRSFLNTDI